MPTLKKIETWFFFGVLMLLALTVGYFISYHVTLQSKGEGTNFSNFKNDILVEQNTSSLQQQLNALGYTTKEIIPLGTHRSSRYYADILNGFSPLPLQNHSQSNTYLFQDELDQHYMVVTNDHNGIVSLSKLRE